MDAVLGLVMLGGCGVLVVLVFQARQGRFGANVLMVLAASCATALGIMLATDWPMEVLSGFWAGHSVLAAVLTTLLIVGIGFFAFEVREAQESDRLDRSVTAAGFGGLVDHVVDVEVTLALATRPDPPDKA